MNRMDGKVCVVTGATQGLGAAIARRLAAAGAKGCGHHRPQRRTRRAVARGDCRAHGIWAHFLQADFSRVEDCRMVVAETDRLFGRLDVLVNAGASTARGTILDTTPETFDALFATNVRGPYFLMQEAIKLMIAKEIEGAICNIGSISALAGQPFINAYCASKGALTTLTANTAFSVMANRIRVNQLNVGWMASDHEREIQAEGGDPTGKRRPPPPCPSGVWSIPPRPRGR
jgi:NAD(P)-dependent dehydrogenase (short-subunit alcohol dehydrogenase family)